MIERFNSLVLRRNHISSLGFIDVELAIVQFLRLLLKTIPGHLIQ